MNKQRGVKVQGLGSSVLFRVATAQATQGRAPRNDAGQTGTRV